MMRFNRWTIGLALIGSFTVSAAAAQLPSSYSTPGAAARVDAKRLCAAGDDAAGKPIANWQRAEALARYGIRPESFEGTLERLIPASLGGSNDPDNLFPFHERGEYTLDAKAHLADRLRQMVCDGKISLKDAQGAFKKDWTKAYRQYLQTAVAPGQH